jgi:hypothetical protein
LHFNHWRVSVTHGFLSFATPCLLSYAASVKIVVFILGGKNPSLDIGPAFAVDAPDRRLYIIRAIVSHESGLVTRIVAPIVIGHHAGTSA